VEAKESSVFRPREACEDHHPHACTDGLVFLTYTAYDEDVGDEVERLEVIPCRRCADSPTRISRTNTKTTRVGGSYGVSRLL
jgi:hypothetical protein